MRLRTPLPSTASLGISQDNVIFGMLLLAFLIYIVMKGELNIYLGFFTPTFGNKPTTGGGLASALGSAASTVSNLSIVNSVGATPQTLTAVTLPTIAQGNANSWNTVGGLSPNNTTVGPVTIPAAWVNY